MRSFLVKIITPDNPGPAVLLTEPELAEFLRHTDYEREPGTHLPDSGETTGTYAGVEGKVPVTWEPSPSGDDDTD